MSGRPRRRPSFDLKDVRREMRQFIRDELKKILIQILPT
jgi:hypothetical protein